MGRLIVKADKDLDLYIEWSTIVDAPTFIGTRQETLDYLLKGDRHGIPTREEVAQRLTRTDLNGSSDMSCRDGWWDDAGFIPGTPKGQRWLKRGRLAAYSLLVCGGDEDGAYLLTEPCETDEEEADAGLATASL